MFLIVLCSTFCVFLVAVFVHQIFRRGRSVWRDGRKSNSVRIMVVLGSGGHTTEALTLVKEMNPKKYDSVIYVLAQTDSTSEIRARNLEETEFHSSRQVKFLRIPRSREVHQSWSSTVLSTAKSILFALPVIFREKPDVLLCNGPGTCVPLCAVAWLFNVLMLRRTVIIFVESICRVKSLSLTGKILYPIADLFFVQYSDLKTLYPRSVYLGRLV